MKLAARAVVGALAEARVWLSTGTEIVEEGVVGAGGKEVQIEPRGKRHAAARATVEDGCDEV